MKAMILAAGYGSRLRPLTDTIPKALVDISGVPLLERVIGRLIEFGVTEIIINVHHFKDQIIDFVKTRDSFGLPISFSVEDEILDTGGGLRKTSWFFNDGKPFILHNVDVLTDLNYRQMLQTHHQRNALATLFVRSRATSRYLLFDPELNLKGWENRNSAEKIIVEDGTELTPLAFSGIHIISPKLFTLFNNDGAFSIIKAYLELARQKEKIIAYRDDNCFWLDIGKPETLKRAQRLFTA